MQFFLFMCCKSSKIWIEYPELRIYSLNSGYVSKSILKYPERISIEYVSDTVSRSIRAS